MRAERRDQFPVAAHEADAPARHVVAFGEREEFDGHVHGARHLQDRRRHIAIEHDVGIGNVMDHPDVVLPGHCHDLLEELQIHALRGRIAGEVEDEHLGRGPGGLDGLFQFLEEIHAGHQRHMADIRPGQHEPVGVNRVGRVGHQDRVTRARSWPGPGGRDLPWSQW